MFLKVSALLEAMRGLTTQTGHLKTSSLSLFQTIVRFRKKSGAQDFSNMNQNNHTTWFISDRTGKFLEFWSKDRLIPNNLLHGFFQCIKFVCSIQCVQYH